MLGIIFPFGLTGYFEKLTIIQNLDAGGVVVIYTGNATREISFPLGGIGSGCIGLGGDGRLIDWEIFNHPSKGSRNGYSHLTIKAKNAHGISTRVLNGDIQKDLIGPYLGAQFCGYGYGRNVERFVVFRILKMLHSRVNFRWLRCSLTMNLFPR